MASVFKRGGNKNRGGYWYAQWFDHAGNRKTQCTNTTDNAAALRIARKFEADAALRREGVIDAAAEKLCEQGRLAIEHHLSAYERKLNSEHRTEQYVRETKGYIEAVCEACSFDVAGDIQAEGVQKFAEKLKTNGRSARTIGAYLKAMKGFTKWLVVHDKLSRDPLASVKCPNPKTDRRLERRILLPEEWDRLEPVTKIGPESFGMSGKTRSLLYAAAIQTGLRSGELRSLTSGKVVVDASKPYIRCKSGATKNRKDARQYIDQRLAEGLRKYLGMRRPGLPVFDLPDETDMAQMLRSDLARAREAWLKEADSDGKERERREESDFLTVRNHEGETLDFHSLRHTCGAWLAMTGAHPKVVQTVMRHSTITLTMDTYGHLFPSTESDAVAQLGNLMRRRQDSSLSNNGNGKNRRKSRSPWRSSQDAEGRETARRDATPCEKGGVAGNAGTNGKSPRSGARSDAVRGGTMPCSPQAPLAQLAEQLTLNQ